MKSANGVPSQVELLEDNRTKGYDDTQLREYLRTGPDQVDVVQWWLDLCGKMHNGRYRLPYDLAVYAELNPRQVLYHNGGVYELDAGGNVGTRLAAREVQTVDA